MWFANWYVNGHELINPSALMMAVINSSSLISASHRIAFIDFFADFNINSKAPLKCGFNGGLKCHFTDSLPGKIVHAVLCQRL